MFGKVPVRPIKTQLFITFPDSSTKLLLFSVSIIANFYNAEAITEFWINRDAIQSVLILNLNLMETAETAFQVLISRVFRLDEKT